MTPRSRIILLVAPAALMVLILLGQWALQSIGVGLPKYAEVDLKALGSFPFSAEVGRTQDIPRRWRDLDGRRVELKGFMYNPISAQPAGTGLQKYQLVYNMPSGFKPLLVQERVYATAPISTPVLSSSDIARVRGVLHVGVRRDQTGSVSSVFRIDVESAADLEDETNTTNETPSGAGKWVVLLFAYALVVAFALIAEWRRRRIISRRSSAGLCPSCGYDVRASIWQCPECGARIRGRPVQVLQQQMQE